MKTIPNSHRNQLLIANEPTVKWVTKAIKDLTEFNLKPPFFYCGNSAHWRLMFPVVFGRGLLFKKTEKKASMILQSFNENCFVTCLIDFSLFSHQHLSSLCHKLLELFTFELTKACGRLWNTTRVKASSMLYKLCVQCMFNHMTNKPRLDLLIIKMQSNLLAVCGCECAWRGSVSSARTQRKRQAHIWGESK